jgi:type III secretory pathway component EscV
MPYTNEGRSIADLVMPLQYIRSTIFRQILDNAYQINNARTAINKRVNMDDYLSNRVGGAVRVSGEGSWVTLLCRWSLSHSHQV